MIIATCGHVDHGKTLLVNALTGIQTDRLDVEQQRGLTIDLGFAYADFGQYRLGFIDVPGHIRFIDNMLAGVSIIDFGLLIIAADDGPMPQTREHLAILELLQISQGAVALTKIDRVDAARVTTVRSEIANLLSTTAFADSPVFPVSSLTGEGVPVLAKALEDAASQVEARPDRGHFRLAVDRAFTIKGAGIVVTGSVFSGRVVEGDELMLMPQNEPVRVRAIHRQNQSSDYACAGDRCSLNIAGAGLTRELIHRGNWLTTNPAPATSRADASIRVLATEKKPLRHWTPVHIHTAASHVTGRVATLESDRIEPGDRGLVQLVLSQPTNLCRGDRLILRDQAALITLGGGIIIEPWSPARGRTKPERLQRLRPLLADSIRARLNGFLTVSPGGFDIRPFRQAENLTDEEWRDLIPDASEVVTAGNSIISVDQFSALGNTLVEHLTAWHGRNPKVTGANRQQLAKLLTDHVDPDLLELLAARLTAAGHLVKSGSTWAVPGHAIRLTLQEENLWRRIQPLLADTPTRPPVVHDIARQLNQAPAGVQQLLIQCVHVGYVIRPVANRFFLPEGLGELARLVRKVANAAPQGQFSVRQFRDATDIGRNLSIEILEYFDRTGVTIRMGDKRKLARPD